MPNLLLMLPLEERVGHEDSMLDTQVHSEGGQQSKGYYPLAGGICAQGLHGRDVVNVCLHAPHIAAAGVWEK